MFTKFLYTFPNSPIMKKEKRVLFYSELRLLIVEMKKIKRVKRELEGA